VVLPWFIEGEMSNDQIIVSEVFTSNLIIKIKANGMVLIKCPENVDR